MFDRLVGIVLLASFGPSLALMSMALFVARGRPVFERRLRIDNGRIYRTMRFRLTGCRGEAYLRQYGLDELPVLIDLALGRARIEADRSTQHADGQRRLAIRAPRPSRTSHPSAAKASHASTVIE